MSSELLLSKKSPGVVALIEQMEQLRGTDTGKYVDVACDLFDMAQESGNEDLRNYASCTLGDALCANNEFAQAIYYLTAGLQGILNTDEYALICRCYNEIGIIMRSEGHFITSEENFINSIDMARAHRMYYQEAIGCGNFAGLCVEMGAKNEALEYYYRAIECCQFIEDEEERNLFLVDQYAQIAKLYVSQGALDEAKRALDEMDRLDKETLDCENYFDVSISRLYYYNAIGDKEKAAKYKEESIKAYYECKDIVIYFDEIESLIKILLGQKDYKELEKLLDHFDMEGGEDEAVNIRLRMEAWKIKMYEATGDKVKMAQSAYYYSKYASKKSTDTKKSFITTLRLKTELIQQKTKNLFLSAQAETDTLTGLANRMKLNNVIDELFEMALEKGKSLGVEMMDVDFFKLVNDNYGHAKGDLLLASMGQGFKNLINEKIFIARYGGDEFIIYYYDMSDEEILDVVGKIRDMMDEIGKKIEVDNLSVSQGIINKVPEQGNRAWDYLNVADYALYHVKEHGKNNAQLVHSRKEVEALNKQ